MEEPQNVGRFTTYFVWEEACSTALDADCRNGSHDRSSGVATANYHHAASARRLRINAAEGSKTHARKMLASRANP